MKPSFAEQMATRWQHIAAMRYATARECFESPAYRQQAAFWQREGEHASAMSRDWLDHAIGQISYAERERQRRFAVFANGNLHCETVDREHAEHVARLLESDGVKAIMIRVFTANQESTLCN